MRYSLLITALIVTALSGCKKEFDNPPLKQVNDGARLSIRQLKERTTGANSLYKFGQGDTNLYCTVTMDESNGNLYKQVYVRDEQGDALCVKLQNSRGLFAGDQIRINLNGIPLVCANNMISLDSVSLEKSIVKLSSGNQVSPLVTTLSKLLTYSDSPREEENLQSQLVELNQTEFHFSDRGKPFANAIGRSSLEYLLTDCEGRQISVRTSGMCNFASKLTPSGNGKVIAVVQQYNNSLNLVIRDYKDLQMQNTACVTTPPTTITGQVFLQKNFNDNSALSGGWMNATSTGTVLWQTSDYGHSSPYAKIYNKVNAVYEPCESWLISPPVNINDAIDPVLNFEAANSSASSPLALMVSTNYNEGAPQLANWTAIAFPQPKGNFTFLNAGLISLANFKSTNLRIAFRYSGTATSGSIWEIDNVTVFDPEK